jgi:hypothetical protein
MNGVDESDAKAKTNQFLRKLQAWSDMPLGRKRDYDCVQNLLVPRFDLLHLFHCKHPLNKPITLHNIDPLTEESSTKRKEI